MLVFHELCLPSETDTGAVQRSLTLPFQKRRLSRQRARLDDGEDVAIVLPRGTILREGTLLRDEGDERVRVRAGPERVSRISSEDVLLLARAAYHLGNRHVAVQIGKGRLSYLHDHVLDDLVLGLGLRVTIVDVPFEPEAGAYGRHDGHRHHSHDDHDGYEHEHEHEHVHSHAGHSHRGVLSHAKGVR